MKKCIILILTFFCLHIPVSVATEQKRITVGLIDSGIDLANTHINYQRVLEGKSYIEEMPSYSDKIGHGTAIAGIIQSIAPDSNIVPLMYISKYPSEVPINGGVQAICRAIYDSVDKYNCKIINISSGIYNKSDELEKAVKYAESKNVIIVSAVGNDNMYESGRLYYPAAIYTVIGVGAVDDNLKVADFSQRNKSVKNVEKGVNINAISIKNQSEYTTVRGTSYAAAVFCAKAVKFLEEYRDITPMEFRKLLRCSSVDLGESGYDEAYGYGMASMELLKKNYKLLKDGEISIFDDVKKEERFFEYINRLAHKGLLKGTEEGLFLPKAYLTRGMLVSILYRLDGEPATKSLNVFNDVHSDDWYSSAVEWAVKNDISKGVGKGMFAPDSFVSKEQLATILYNYVVKKGYNVSQNKNEKIALNDNDDFADYSVKAIKWACDNKIMDVDDNGILGAKEFITRANAVEIILKCQGDGVIGNAINLW